MARTLLNDGAAYAAGAEADFRTLIDSYDDAALQGLMTNLGGHCYETLLEAFEYASRTDARTCFLAFTIKGYGLPLQRPPRQPRPLPRAAAV